MDNGLLFHIFQVGSAGIDGINHKTNFALAFHKLCVTVQKLFDKLLENETEVEQFDYTNEESFLRGDSINEISKIRVYVENCLIFIKAMIL